MSSVPPSGRSSLFGLEHRVAGMLAYTPGCLLGIGPIISILILVMEKRNRGLRFHALQSLLAHGAWIAVSLVMTILTYILQAIAPVLGFLGTMVNGMILLAFCAALILMMLKTYNNEEIELPFAGEIAKKWL
jgi:uncharacterized membrane protein